MNTDVFVDSNDKEDEVDWKVDTIILLISKIDKAPQYSQKNPVTIIFIS